MSGIIWLASYPKSGNTWMRAFIATYLEDPDRPLRINDLPRYALGDSQVEHFERLSGKALAEMSRKEVNWLRGRVQEWFVNTRPEDVFVKTHNIIAKAGQMPLISPSVTAGAIYIVRNPLDVAISLAHHFQIPLDRAIEILCDRASVLPASETTVEQYVASWSRNARSWLNAQGLVLHVTRYEDMRRKPFKAFGAVVKFLDLPLLGQAYPVGDHGFLFKQFSVGANLGIVLDDIGVFAALYLEKVLSIRCLRQNKRRKKDQREHHQNNESAHYTFLVNTPDSSHL